MAVRTPGAERPSPPPARPWLAALLAFWLCLIAVASAAFLTAPTKLIPIFPLRAYVAEAIRSGGGYVGAATVCGALLGAGAARAVYRVWGNATRRAEMVAGYLFLAPYLVITLVFTAGVLLFALDIAFYRYDIFRAPVFTGLVNFVQAFTTRDFIQSLVNAGWYCLIVLPVQTALGLLLALLLNSQVRGRGFWRAVCYAPGVVPPAVASILFWWLYLKTGYLNSVLAGLTEAAGLHFVSVDWLNDPRGLVQLLAEVVGLNIPSAYWYLRGPSITWTAIMLLTLFTSVPAFMIMFLAALRRIPVVLYEASRVDGATGRQQFFSVTLPLLRPSILLVTILGTIGALQIFDQVRILTNGGPLGTTMTPVLLAYREALGASGQIRMGYGTALAWILAAIIFGLAAVQRRLIAGKSE